MLHFIRFYSGEGKPTILFRENGEVEALELRKKEKIDFSGSLACIGFRTPKGYKECKNHAINVKQCPLCSYLDMAKAYTVGDFTGFPSLYEKAKKEKYILYLAGFGEKLIKCGVTRKERFSERMREQGSDFGCIVAEFSGPDKVYGAEASLQSRFSFANAVRMAQKMRMLSFDKQEAKMNFESIVEMVKTSEVLPSFSPKVIDFSEFYPKINSPKYSDSVIGKILGAKGEILLFSSGSGEQYAVNMRQKIGTFFKRETE